MRKHFFANTVPSEPDKPGLRCLDQIVTYSKQAGSKDHTAVSSTLLERPLPGSIKINMDVVLKPYSTNLEIGFVMRNDKGKFLSAGIDTDFAGSPEEGECIGLSRVAHWAGSMRSLPPESYIIIETDCRGL